MLPLLDDKAVLVLTKAGERDLHEGGTSLSPLHLEALVLIDGHASVAEVIKRARNVPADKFRECLAELVAKGFVSAIDHFATDGFDPGDFFTSVKPKLRAAQPGEEASADTITIFLRQNGYCVNLARRRQARQAPAREGRPTVLVVDDDPDICALLQTYLKMEGFDTRVAGNRAEIIAELRRAPLPDVVLLDVWLPDANGFDILAKMRQHPVLKDLPVIMLTAEATREAVLKGLLGGADGYITKPFDIHPMVRAVKVALGLQAGAAGQDWDYSL